MNFTCQTRMAGFTRADLLALLATLTLAALGVVGGAATTRSRSEAVRCTANLQNLARAWTLYAQDNAHRLPGAAGWNAPGGAVPNWSGGSWLDISSGQERNPNNWDHETYTRRSVLWPYLQEASSFTCPSDPSRAIHPETGQTIRRIRSYALSCWVGGPGWDISGPWVPQARTGWRVHVKLDDFSELPPGQAFTFVDEREDSINDGHFPTDMTGYPEAGEARRLVDFPTDIHEGAGQFAFADGHVDSHRWQDPRTRRPHDLRLIPLNVPHPQSVDVLWLQDHATRMVK